MSIFREIPPTAGFPIYLKDFFSIFKKEARIGSLEDDFKEYLDVDYAKVAYSGTAALYIILESLKELSPHKKAVIIPSFICPLVPLAIKRAGLDVEVCDINGDDFNFNPAELENLCSKNNDILAIVPTHLGGIPLDLEAIEKIVKRYGIFIIEDCAQSLGATYKGKKLGTRGDFSFFSLCRGKGLTIYEGGVIVANRRDYASVIDKKIKQLVNEDFPSESIKVLELFGYWLFYRPHLFWFVFRLPQILWNMQGERLKACNEEFTVNFPLHKVSAIRKLVGHLSFYRLEEEIKKQRQKADYYIQRIKDIAGIRVIKEDVNARATYPYLTLLFDDPDKRNRAFGILQNLGLGVSSIYALAISDYGYLKDIMLEQNCPHGRLLAQRQLTLSTSAFLKQKDLDCVLGIIKNLSRPLFDYSF